MCLKIQSPVTPANRKHVYAPGDQEVVRSWWQERGEDKGLSGDINSLNPAGRMDDAIETHRAHVLSHSLFRLILVILSHVRDQVRRTGKTRINQSPIPDAAIIHSYNSRNVFYIL